MGERQINANPGTRMKCGRCGKRFTRAFGTSRIYCVDCSPAQRRVTIAPVPEPGPDGSEVEHPMVTAVRAELEAAGRERTTDGLVLIATVQLLARGDHTATGFKALRDAYAAQREIALAGVATEKDAGSQALGEIFG